MAGTIGELIASGDAVSIRGRMFVAVDALPLVTAYRLGLLPEEDEPPSALLAEDAADLTEGEAEDRPKGRRRRE